MQKYDTFENKFKQFSKIEESEEAKHAKKMMPPELIAILDRFRTEYNEVIEHYENTLNSLKMQASACNEMHKDIQRLEKENKELKQDIKILHNTLAQL